MDTATPEHGESSGAAGSSGLGDPSTLESYSRKADEAASSGSRFACCSCRCVFLSLISLVFLGLFVYSAVVQGTGDEDGLPWIVFYAFNAAVPAFFLVSYTVRCFPIVPVVYLFSTITAVWSVVYIAIASLNAKNTRAGGAEEGGDNDNETLLGEYIYELAGASIALFSSLYHCLVAKRCVGKEQKSEENEEEKTEENEEKNSEESEEGNNPSEHV